MKLTYLEPADHELQKAIEYHVQQSDVVAERFGEAYREALQRVLDQPEAWPLLSKNTRCCRESGRDSDRGGHALASQTGILGASALVRSEIMGPVPLLLTRRHLLGRAATGVGTLGLASLLNPRLFADEAQNSAGGLAGFPNFAPKAKRVIYLFQSGAPSQMDLFDYKPKLADRRAKTCRFHRKAATHRHDLDAGRSVAPACSSSRSTASAARGSAS